MSWLKKENPLCIKTDASYKVSQGLFFAVYTIFMFARSMSDTTYKYEHSTTILTQIAWICCFLAILNIFFLCRYSCGQLLAISLFLAIYFFIWFQTQRTDAVFLQSMIIVFSCCNVKWEYVLKYSLLLHISLILLPAIFEQIGVFPSIEVYRGNALRYSFGFSHPNVLGGHCLSLVLIWLLIRYQKLKVYDYIGWILIAIFLWFVPNSKTSTFLVLFICVLAFIFHRWGDLLITNKVIQIVSISFGWLMAGFSIISSYFYNADNAAWVWIDKNLFTTRLSCAQGFLNEYPIKLFGQKLKFVDVVTAANNGTKSYVLDNFYVRQLVQMGVISLLIVLILFTYLCYRAIQTRNQEFLIGLLIIMIYCVYENRGVNLIYNVLLFQVVYQASIKRRFNDDQGICDYSSV